jgi:hypothetical protein
MKKIPKDKFLSSLPDFNLLFCYLRKIFGGRIREKNNYPSICEQFLKTNLQDGGQNNFRS